MPLWIDEGLADYLRGLWDPLDVMMIREGAVSDQIPKISRSEYQALSGREANDHSAPVRPGRPPFRNHGS